MLNIFSLLRIKRRCLRPGGGRTVTPWSVSPVLVIVSTPSRCRLLSLVYLSLCFLSLCASSSCMFPSQPVCFSRTPVFAIFLFLILLVLNLACSGFCTHLPDHSACLDLEPVCHYVPPGLWSGFDLLPVHDHSLAYSFGIIKHLKLQTSASCVCIWDSPCVMLVCYLRLHLHVQITSSSL